MVGFRGLGGALVASLSLASVVSAANTVKNTILVFARDTASGYSGTSGLAGYGIPYQVWQSLLGWKRSHGLTTRKACRRATGRYHASRPQLNYGRW